MSEHNFLVELGTEELPAKKLIHLQDDFVGNLFTELEALGVRSKEIAKFATPRRLAVVFEGLPYFTPKTERTVWGPPVQVAYDPQGRPTKAAEAFAAKNGISIDELKTSIEGKVEKLVCIKADGGEPLTRFLPGVVEKAVMAIGVEKRMRWGSGRAEFVRPVRWLIMLFDDHVIPGRVLGIEAGRRTRGHRVHSNDWISFDSAPTARQYWDKLEAAKVNPNWASRESGIRNAIEEKANSLGGKVEWDIPTESLLAEVTSLVEWPVVLAGEFDERFLAVPAEALISSMREHQKYFHVTDAQGKLMRNFITVANIESTDEKQVIEGNQRVIRPRLSDAAFFFETDKKKTLSEHREKLKAVVFQAQLGTMFDKTERIAKLAGFIARKLGENDVWAERAGRLSKADLATAMVYEFADMQGIAGFYYGQKDGEDEEVFSALKEHYLPKFARDELPQRATGVIVALADRLDTLVGIFGLGQMPTGSKDPFGLRRASFAVLRLLTERGYDLDLRELLNEAANFYPSLPKGRESVDLALNYILERFRAWWAEQDRPAEEYQAVAVKGLTNPLEIRDRLLAIRTFTLSPDAGALAAANKRVVNILAKQSVAPSATVNHALFSEPAEKELARQLDNMKAKVEPLFAQREYGLALSHLTSLRPAVDEFFDKVMVMAEDPQLRANRLALLANLRDLFWEVADISQLAVSQ